MSDDLASWLSREIEARDLTYRKLADRAGTTHTTIADVVNRQRAPTYDVCVKLARALQVPLDDLLVLAGLRRPAAAPVEEELALLDVFREQSPTVRRVVVAMLRGLGKRGPRVVGMNEHGPAYEVDAPLEAELLAEFRRLPAEWREDAIYQVQTLVRLARLPRVRVIGGEDLEDEA